MIAAYLGRETSNATARLYRNHGDGTFEDASAEAGVDDNMLTMGSNFGDLDNDGFLDFYVGTGEPDLDSLVPNRMFRNDGGKRFRTSPPPVVSDTCRRGTASPSGDLDADGDQDIYTVMGGAYPADVAYDALYLGRDPLGGVVGSSRW